MAQALNRSSKSPTLPLTLATVVFGAGFLVLFLLVILHVMQGQAGFGPGVVLEAIFTYDGSLLHDVVRYVRLPRTVVGIVAGAAFAVSGVLFQTVTRNPLASPATLGVNAGAYLALVLAAVFAPGLPGGSLMIAFAGGLVAAGLVYALAAGAGATPLRLALAGVAVSLALAAVTGSLQLIYENETAGLFLWGAGSLAQNDWSGVVYALPRVAVGLTLALLMVRALDLLLLGDDVARSLGLRVQRNRLGATVLAVFLAASAVSVVGPIAFVGLIVPHLVRLVGLKHHLLLLPASALWGAVLLIAADILAQQVGTNVGDLPAGAVTALIGAPFLVWLARRVGRSGGVGKGEQGPARRGPALPYPLLLSGVALLLTAMLVVGMSLGSISLSIPELVRTVFGEGNALHEQIVFGLRLPRLLVAALAGGSLAASGLLLQGVVRNPLAGPEIIGITSGAGVSALTVLILFPETPLMLIPLAALAGAFAAFAVVYLASWQGGVSPTRLALVGLAVSAFCAAIINVLIVQADVRVAQALVWLSGSIYARGWQEVGNLIFWPLLLLPVAFYVARWLDLLALGELLPTALGLPLERARAIVLTLAVALAAAAVSIVGTISFVGLIAPHVARLLGGHRHRRLLPLAVLLGALLVVSADILGRVLLAPKQIPAGLVTAVLGAPYFLWLLWRGRGRLS